jgi:hypothetical protein
MLKYVGFTVLALIDLLVIAASTIAVPMSAMLFDSGETPLLWAKFLGMAAVPLLALIGIVSGLVWLFAFKSPTIALWLVGAPLIYLVLFGIFFVVAWPQR